MIREEVLDLIRRVPVEDHTKLVLVLSTGTSVNLDMIARVEPNYIAIRGREAGSNDEGRGFFIPFETIALIKLEKTVRLNEFRAMYNEPLQAETGLDAPTPDAAGAAAASPAPAKVTAVVTGPADIAKQNLLDRIRAARTSAGARTIK
jgi:hypothetical protein